MESYIYLCTVLSLVCSLELTTLDRESSSQTPLYSHSNHGSRAGKLEVKALEQIVRGDVESVSQTSFIIYAKAMKDANCILSLIGQAPAHSRGIALKLILFSSS